MNFIFRDTYSKLIDFHFFPLFAKFRYKYCKSNITYQLSNKKVFIYQNLKKSHKEMNSTENEMHMTKI